MKRIFPGIVLAVALLGIVATLTARSVGAADAQATTSSAQIERGHYLVTLGGCNDCHTPWKMGENGPEPDMSRMLSGHPQEVAITAQPATPEGVWMAVVSNTFTGWSGPWGVSFSRNLTPDKETGLGSWTEQQFVATMRTGHQRGIGRPLLPPMPWQNYGQATDGDLAAIFAYLQSIPAISNRVPDPLPPAAAPAGH